MATDDTTVRTGDAYEIIKADPKLPNTLEVNGKEYKFRDNGMMRVKDRGEAFAIREKYGKGKRPAITTTRVNYPHPSDRGHKYTFAGIAMPWHRFDENGKRIDNVGEA